MTIRFAAVTILVCIGCALPAPALAQGGSDYRGDYTAGVNLFDSVRNRGETTTYSPGWFAGASYRIIPVISLVGEMAGDYNKEAGTSFYLYTFSGGARFQSGSKSARLRPFAQVLMGTGMDNGSVGQSPTKNHFPVVTPGGGIDLALTKHLAGRLKLDFPLYATFGDVHKGIRMSLGISMPVGTR